jgi:hypothetical protein
LDQLKLEEDMVQAGTHPDYLMQLQDLENRKESGLAALKDLLKHSHINESVKFETLVKFANETLLVGFWIRGTKFLGTEKNYTQADA